jgi:hypothetical protein
MHTFPPFSEIKHLKRLHFDLPPSFYFVFEILNTLSSWNLKSRRFNLGNSFDTINDRSWIRKAAKSVIWKAEQSVVGALDPNHRVSHAIETNPQSNFDRENSKL